METQLHKILFIKICLVNELSNYIGYDHFMNTNLVEPTEYDVNA